MFFKNFFQKTVLFLFLSIQQAIFALNIESSKNWQIIDKENNTVTLEYYEINSIPDFFDIYQQLIPIEAQAFSDEIYNCLENEECLNLMKDYILDQGLDVKSEIKIANSDRETRLNHEIKKQQDRLELARQACMENSINFSKNYIILAKNSRNDILGFAMFEPKINQIINLGFLVIDPTYQGLGLARHLIFSILDILPEFNKITLAAYNWNTKAKKIYEHLGFNVKIISRMTNEFEYTKN